LCHDSSHPRSRLQPSTRWRSPPTRSSCFAPLPGAAAAATHDQKERLLGLLREGLLAIEALPRVGTEGYFADWRALVQRSDLTAKELKLLEHLARKMKRAGRTGE
jgi:tRNA C32,U32 (ribose-2'-O)-methylase TrmJ